MSSCKDRSWTTPRLPFSLQPMATGRKRSGTLSSQLLAQNQTFAGYPTGPITLQAQTHTNGANQYPNVLLNRERVPYFQVGDIIELRSPHMKQPCIFMIDQNDPVNLPPTLQVSLSKDIASCFGISSGTEVTILKVFFYLKILLVLIEFRSIERYTPQLRSK